MGLKGFEFGFKVSGSGFGGVQASEGSEVWRREAKQVHDASPIPQAQALKPQQSHEPSKGEVPPTSASIGRRCRAAADAGSSSSFLQPRKGFGVSVAHSRVHPRAHEERDTKKEKSLKL